jgi:pSer/pThr/pTyr-binding forkhead associated (FHA) protein
MKMLSWKVTLVVTRGPQEGLMLMVNRPSIQIGRDKEMDLILSDPAVSGKHARITISPHGIELEDLDSKSGTFVNDVPVQSSALKNLDRIVLGQSEILLKIQAPDKAKHSPAPAETKAGEKPEIKEEIKAKGIQVPILSRVLVAGFPDNLRKLLVSQIMEHNLCQEVNQAQSGGDALQQLSEALKEGALPELIITSVRMPILNGVNTAIAFRAYEQGLSRPWYVPIIFLCPALKSDDTSFKKALAFLAPARHVPASEDPLEFAKDLQNLFTDLRERAGKGESLA